VQYVAIKLTLVVPVIHRSVTRDMVLLISMFYLYLYGFTYKSEYECCKSLSSLWLNRYCLNLILLNIINIISFLHIGQFELPCYMKCQTVMDFLQE
jgi:hypothetical protein